VSYELLGNSDLSELFVGILINVLVSDFCKGTLVDIFVGTLVDIFVGTLVDIFVIISELIEGTLIILSIKIEIFNYYLN
jgi:hypothetical protein